jgi:hypothetical protein
MCTVFCSINKSILIFALAVSLFSSTIPNVYSDTIGGGTIEKPASGPKPAYGIGGPNMVLVKNWEFGTNGNIKNITDLNTNFQYHDRFNTWNTGWQYGASTVAPDQADALPGQPVEGKDTAAPVRSFTANSLLTYLVPLNGATTVDPNKINGGCGSFTPKWTLPHAGSLLGQDIVWETRVRYVIPKYYWFALWMEGNNWKGGQGAEFDLVESYGWDGGQFGDNFNGNYWHSNVVDSPNKTDTVDYGAWPSGMRSVGFNAYDPTQYHIWTMRYNRDNSYAFYVDGKIIQSGANYYWTFGHLSDGQPIDMEFMFDATWGNNKVWMDDHTLPAAGLANCYYEFNYSRVYLSNPKPSDAPIGVADGTFKIANATSGLLASAGSINPKSGNGAVTEGADAANPSQQWTITSSGDYYTITSVSDKLNLSVDHISILLMASTAAKSQLWALVKSGNSYKLQNAQSRHLLSVDPKGPTTSGDPLLDQNDANDSSQLWNLTRQ